MDILYISHCVPWPPDKGERIRAFHSVRLLLDRHRVHLACLARSELAARAASDLKGRCASVRIVVLDRNRAIIRGLRNAAFGGCFTTAFYADPELRRQAVAILRDEPIRAAILLSSGMAPFAPANVPFLADWGDVDSEKRFEYARLRWSGLAQRIEGGRLRRVERDVAMRARHTYLTTENERQLFQRIAPKAPASVAGNGVDFDWFDPSSPFAVPDGLRHRRFLVFVGVLSYFPNLDGICRFAETIFPALRRREPEIELLIVGRGPPSRVLRLGELPGVTVVGEVADVRPYLAASIAAVVPLRIARGIQNKVLEALAMGKVVLASEETCRTFEPDTPVGLMRCSSADEYAAAIEALPREATADCTIREATRTRFTWSASLAPLLASLEEIERDVSPASAPPP